MEDLASLGHALALRAMARTIKKHRQEILNAIGLRVTNAKAEATNSQIQRILREEPVASGVEASLILFDPTPASLIAPSVWRHNEWR